MSFLQRLKGRGVCGDDASLVSGAEMTVADKVAQLLVDIYQTEGIIVIYAQSAGADINDVQVSIEGDADIVLIEGKRVRPEYQECVGIAKKKVSGSYVAEECVWGEFYRRIILPESVNIDKAEAKIKNGVLILVLPLSKLSEKEKVQLKVTGGRRAAKQIK